MRKETTVKLKELLHEKNILLSDGAWGTEIAKRGFEPGICTELFNLNETAMIREIAVMWFEGVLI